MGANYSSYLAKVGVAPGAQPASTSGPQHRAPPEARPPACPLRLTRREARSRQPGR